MWLAIFSKARIAQLAEQLICNQQVVGSNPTAGSKITMGSVITVGLPLIITEKEMSQGRDIIENVISDVEREGVQ